MKGKHHVGSHWRDGCHRTAGRLVVDQLLARTSAERVVAIARNPDKVPVVLEKSVQTRIADRRPCGGSMPPCRRRRPVLISGTVRRRMAQHENVILAAQQAGVSRIVYTSAPHADTSETAIVAEHKATERMIRESGLTYTILRNNSYHQNYVPFLEPARTTGAIIGSARRQGGQRRSRRLRRGGRCRPLECRTRERGLRVDRRHVLDLSRARRDSRGRARYAGDVPGPLAEAEHAEVLRASGVDGPTIDFLVQLDADVAAGVSAEATNRSRHLIGRPTTPLLDGLRAAAARLR